MCNVSVSAQYFGGVSYTSKHVLLIALFAVSDLIKSINHLLRCSLSWCLSHFSTRSFCLASRLSNFSLIFMGKKYFK